MSNDYICVAAKTVLIATLGLLNSSLAFAQVCNTTEIVQNISAANFNTTTLAPGIAQDNLTKLIWSRCVYGQNWSAEKNTCIGVPERKTWAEALTLAQTTDLNGTTGWRIPDLKELSTLIDYQCLIPPLNPTIFPNAPGSISHGLWTSSPVFIYTNLAESSPRIWSIDLETGGFLQHFLSDRNYILFVKTPP